MGKNKNGLKKYDNVGYFFVLPFVIVFCIFSVYPVLRTLYFSFTNAKIAGVGVTSWVWLTITSVYSQTNFSGERFGTR